MVAIPDAAPSGMGDAGRRALLERLCVGPTAVGDSVGCPVCTVSWGEWAGVPDFVRLTLDDGSTVLFQSAESDLVSMHSGAADVTDADAASGRLEVIAKASQQMCESLRSQMAPDEVQLQIGVGLSAELGWFFAKTTAEGNLTVTLTWKGPAQ